MSHANQPDCSVGFPPLVSLFDLIIRLPPSSSMSPSSATPRRTSLARCRRRRNAAAGGTGATAREFAAGLWRHRHGSSSSTMLGANQRRMQCPCSRNHQGGILDKYGAASMEKATKWDRVYGSHYLDDIFSKEQKRSRSTTMVALLESELDRARARARIGELENERRVTSKRLQRFLRRMEEEKNQMKEGLRLERKHRRELEAANARLLRELSEARQAAKQQAQSYEMERKARELMEEACSELTREVEEDQAEVELLRQECLRMREEMEEERRMLQMAEVWREERVQMKLSDAKLALEHKYSQLNRLQAEMEAFLSLRHNKDKESAALRVNGDAAASSSLLRSRHDEKVDVDSVFEHFRRKEEKEEESPASSSNNLESVSPATDLFLAKADNDDPFSDDGSADNGDRDSCSDLSVSVPVAPASNDASLSHNNNNGASGRSGATKNTAPISRLWSTAITESRKKTGPAPRNGGAQANGGGWSPPSGRNRRSSVAAAAAAAEQCSSSGHQQREQRRGTQHYKQSLKEKLMEARMEDHKEKPPSDRKKH